MQLKAGISPSYNAGKDIMNATGIGRLVVGPQLKVGISPSSNGRDRMDAHGISGLVRLQLEVLTVTISTSSNGPERTDVPVQTNSMFVDKTLLMDILKIEYAQ